MGATLSLATTTTLQYCRRHQRAWVESLGQWVAFPERAMYGSPVPEAACDLCAAEAITMSTPSTRLPHGPRFSF
jgi:hypothetical protein